MGQLPQDPIMLYSVINTKLRDFYSSLEVLCEDMGLSEEELKEKLSSAGFEYDKDRNQFIQYYKNFFSNSCNTSSDICSATSITSFICSFTIPSK